MLIFQENLIHFINNNIKHKTLHTNICNLIKQKKNTHSYAQNMRNGSFVLVLKEVRYFRLFFWY